MTSKLARSLVSLVALGSAIVSCGDAGTGGLPGQPGPSGGPISATGSGQTSGGGLPGQPSPGSGSGVNGGATGGGDISCDAVCAHLASCGSTKNDKCAAGCPTATPACRQCIGSTPCDEITKTCLSVCQTASSGAGGGPPSSEGAGGSGQGAGQGAGAHGVGGSSTTTKATCQDLQACCSSSSFPMSEMMTCNGIVMNGQDASCNAYYQVVKSICSG